MKGHCNPISCDFLEEILVLAQGTAAQKESSPCPLLQDPAAQSTVRESKALLGLDLVKLLALSVRQATLLTFSPTTFSLVRGNPVCSFTGSQIKSLVCRTGRDR